MQIRTLGIDLGKTIFHLVGLNALGEVGVRNKSSPKHSCDSTANLRVASSDMNVCPGAHFSSRIESAGWLSGCGA